MKEQVKRGDCLHDLLLTISATKAEENQALLALAEYKQSEIDRPILFDKLRYEELCLAAMKAERKHLQSYEDYRRQLVIMVDLIDEHTAAITATPIAPKRDMVTDLINHMLSTGTAVRSEAA